MATPTATFRNSGPYKPGDSGFAFFYNANGDGSIFFYSFDFDNDGVYEVVNSLQSVMPIPAAAMVNGRKIKGRIRDRYDNFKEYTTTVVIKTDPLPPPPSSPPATPANLVGQDSPEGVIRWDSVPEALSYNVYRSDVSGGAQGTVYGNIGRIVGQFNVAQYMFSDVNAEIGKEYYYRVSAVNAGGESPLTPEVEVRRIGITDAPTGLTASVVNKDVALSWVTTKFAYSYNLYRDGTFVKAIPAFVLENVNPDPKVSSVTLVTSYNDLNVASGPHTYTLSAYNQFGESVQSQGFAVVVP